MYVLCDVTVISASYVINLNFAKNNFEYSHLSNNTQRLWNLLNSDHIFLFCQAHLQVNILCFEDIVKEYK